MGTIAERAGVSRATVSYVLNGRESTVRISEETRSRVLELADQMGYRPNALAQSVATGKNRMIGLLSWNPEYEPFARMLSGALDEAEAHNYTIKVLRVRPNGLEKAIIERCADLRLAGVIALNVSDTDLQQLHASLARYAMPLAVLDTSFAHPWGVRVISDDGQGCRLVVEHLRGLGHERIALMSGDPADGVAILREEGFAAAMKNAGLDVPTGFVARGFWNTACIEAATRELLEHPDGAPTAIACASDETAMVVTRTARALGRSLPRDLSIVGFSDLATAQHCDPPLTTIAPPFQQMGRTVVQQLLERVAGNEAEDARFNDSPRQTLLPTRLVVRASTAPPPSP